MEYDRTLIITMRDIRRAKQCSHGARAFFELHNLDWGLFLKQGIDAGSVIDTNDVMALQVVECAHGRK